MRNVTMLFEKRLAGLTFSLSFGAQFGLGIQLVLAQARGEKGAEVVMALGPLTFVVAND
jgi:hypothetical protein